MKASLTIDDPEVVHISVSGWTSSKGWKQWRAVIIIEGYRHSSHIADTPDEAFAVAWERRKSLGKLITAPRESTHMPTLTLDDLELDL